MKVTFTAIALTLFAPFSVANELFCDSGSVHPIDAQFALEMEQSGGVTLDMRNAQGNAHDAWDKELNRVYRELMDVLSADEKALLRDAQRAWLTFREAETKLWWTESASGGGTLQPISVAGYSIELLKSRVCQLSRYKHAATPL